MSGPYPVAELKLINRSIKNASMFTSNNAPELFEPPLYAQNNTVESFNEKILLFALVPHAESRLTEMNSLLFPFVSSL